MSRSGPSLTTAQLREIQTRRSADDVMTLLWEIKRLHVILMRADQIARSMRYETGTEGMLLNALRGELERFPVIKEWEEERAEMLRRSSKGGSA